MEEANFLATVTEKVSYFSLKSHDTTSLDPTISIYQEKPQALIKEKEKIQLQTREEKVFETDGVFIFRPAVALHQLIDGLETTGPFIAVNRKMETNIPGVYAAGDCTGQPLQIPKAVGEGNIAAISAAEYIQKITKP
ncbi:MAG: NAD(P)/FAD-dependent oxidoreductase [Clostridiales bacterium]|nr:NAD(P)/FAD-dependent oxidoreductase [Clostridiales bacterium]